MNPVPFNGVMLDLMFYSMATLAIGIIGLFIFTILHEAVGRKKD